MPQATKLTRDNDFSQDELNSITGRSTVKTASLDAELDAVKTTTDQIIDNQSLLLRDDGKLANEAVHTDALNSAVLALISGQWTPKGAWTTATDYVANNLVSENNDAYICIEAHTSGVFATDLAADKWMRIGQVSYADLASTLNGKGMSLIGVEDVAGNFTSTDGEGVLAELATAVNSQQADVDLAKHFPVANWTEISNPKSFGLNAVAGKSDASATIRVAVGQSDGVDSYIIRSIDYGAWAEQAPTVPKTVGLNDVIYGGGQFVAVGDLDGVDSYILTSPTGATWTERAAPLNLSLNSIAYNGSLYVAVGYADGVDAHIITSPDAITWTRRTPTVSRNYNLHGIAWGGGLFVAVGGPGSGTSDYVLTSSDGITWTERATPGTQTLLSVAYGGGVFVAATLTTYYSSDGINWSTGGSLPSQSRDIDYGDGLFVASCINTGGTSGIASSVDGVNWRQQKNGRNETLSGVGFVDQHFLLVGTFDGTDGYLAESLRMP